MKRWLVALTTAAGLAASYGVACAAPLQFSEIQAKNRQTHKYTCATGKILQVTYWNTANGQSFALVPVKGKALLFVNTMSASGAKYQAGSYTWWIKGPRADLYDAMDGENAPPMLSDCVTINR
ncbi:Membrane-bound inhibitor of C-type lysozyme [Burkholderia sp. WP9]|uniref:MliC family protein n=1 Tax=Burkholderia sp. WP9 TaxID=1500263 RepID=UPI00089A839C|nr:MliC family protein [Burkholderia sp. WP9]SEC89747.1 Membrane-bound inhibitor of C-type lysozyme [Burkholderia sp. WP9]